MLMRWRRSLTCRTPTVSAPINGDMTGCAGRRPWTVGLGCGFGRDQAWAEKQDGGDG